jgi:Fibronectin type III domain
MFFSQTPSFLKSHDHAAVVRKSRRALFGVESLDGRLLLSCGLTPVAPSSNPIVYNPPINPPAADPSDTDAPYNFTAKAASTTQINLSWSGNQGAAGYVVCELISGTWKEIAWTPNTSFSVTGLKANTSYQFKIGGDFAFGGAYSNVQTVVTPPPPVVPAAPTGLTAKAASSTQINLTWQPVSGATSYVVEEWNGRSFVKLGTVSGANCTVNSLSPSTTYYYEVAATNSVGTGAFPAYASATT